MTAVQLLQEMFEVLSPQELRQTADMIIGYASDNAIKEIYEFRQPGRDERSDLEKRLW